MKDQTPEEREAGLIRIGTIYQRTDCKTAAALVTVAGVAYQFADPLALAMMLKRHCSEWHLADNSSIRERDQ